MSAQGAASPFRVQGVLFDLDGTLLDTAEDLMAAANQALLGEGLLPCPADELKPQISGGARSMISYWLVKSHEKRNAAPFPSVNVVSLEHESLFERLVEQMLNFYEANPARHTRYFEGMAPKSKDSSGKTTQLTYLLTVCSWTQKNQSRVAALTVLLRYATCPAWKVRLSVRSRMCLTHTPTV